MGSRGWELRYVSFITDTTQTEGQACDSCKSCEPVCFGSSFARDLLVRRKDTCSSRKLCPASHSLTPPPLPSCKSIVLTIVGAASRACLLAWSSPTFLVQKAVRFCMSTKPSFPAWAGREGGLPYIGEPHHQVCGGVGKSPGRAPPACRALFPSSSFWT